MPTLEAPPPWPLAYVDNRMEHNLWLIGTDGVQVFVIDGVSDYSWSPDGNYLAVLRGGDLWLVAADGGTANRLLESGALSQVSWSPSGESIAVVARSPGTQRCSCECCCDEQLLLVKVPGGEAQVLPDEASAGIVRALFWHLDWSPDGRILYSLTCYAGTTAAILGMDVEAGTAELITSGAWEYAVLPGQGTLLVREHRYLNLGSHRVANEYDADGTWLEEWPALENSVFSAGPDGTIAFLGEVKGKISLLRPDGTVIQTKLPLDPNVGTLLRVRGFEDSLDWSPDGDWLAVEHGRYFWLVSTSNGEGRRFVPGYDPRWRPHIDSE
jgi:WD40 repeat protein